ncbi:unnamed protein product [Sphagnum compactum]
MNVQVTQENLNRALSSVARVASSRGTLPILANVLIKTSANRLRLSATNLDIAISHYIGAKVSEEGSITVPAKVMQSLVASLPAGVIELALTDNKLHITTDQYKSSINGIVADDFPVMPAITKADTGQNLHPQAVVKRTDLINVTRVSSLFARESAGSVTIELSEDDATLSIRSIASQLGENTASAKAVVSGSGSITLNSSYNKRHMLSDIRLQNFRSYEDASFEFTDGVNIIVGPNGSGKTNLLEAVLMIASGSSYRARDMELIAFDQPWARLDSDLSSGTVRTVKLLKEPQAEKVFDFEGKMYRRLSLQQKLPVVIFEPEHLSLLSGSPEGRRVFIDDLLEQTVPGFSATRRAYKRTLLQRNALLKQATSTASQFFPWDVRLSALGGQIVKARSSVCHTLHEELQTIYRELSHSGVQISLTYDPRWPEDRYESELLAKLTSSLQLDKDRGFSAYGPHREDVSISYDGHPGCLKRVQRRN